MSSLKNWCKITVKNMISEDGMKFFNRSMVCTATQKRSVNEYFYPVIEVCGGTEENPITYSDIPDEMWR